MVIPAYWQAGFDCRALPGFAREQIACIKFLLADFVIGAIAIIVGIYWYAAENDTGLGIEILVPEAPLVGVPFSVRVSISNAANVVLGDAKVSLSLPEGLAFVGSSPNKNIETKQLGRIGVGGVMQEDFELIATNGENSVKRLTATASYFPEGVRSNFEERKEIDVALAGVGIALDLVLPEQALPGEDFAFEVSYKNISPIDVDGLQLRLDYPPGLNLYPFADIAPNLWRLGGLRKESEMKFSISGNLVGPTSKRYPRRTQAEFDDEVYNVAENRHGGAFGVAFDARYFFPAPGDVALPGTELQYGQLSEYRRAGFQNAVVTAQLSGEMFDLSTLRTKGIVSVSGNMITWNQVTSPELAIIGPRSSGELTFSVRTKGAYPIRRLSDKNFVLKIDARIESPTVIPSVQSKATVGIGRLETKIRGDLRLDAKAFFRDAEAGVVNRGPFPPRVGVATNFTVHWVLRNYATDATGVIVIAALPPGVKYVSSVRMSSGVLSYADGPQIVQWQIDKIPANKGVLDKPLEAVFQIEAMPQPNQAKSAMPLIGEATFTAKDDFTAAELRGGDPAINSSLPDDVTVGSGGGIVVQ